MAQAVPTPTAFEPRRALETALTATARSPRARSWCPPPRAAWCCPVALPRRAALRRLLVALGDLHGAVGVFADTLYDAALAEGVVAFQRRHGLEPDGVIGPATMAQLRVPLSWRVAQLELARERWRQLPDTMTGRFIVVNVPAFRLFYAFERDARRVGAGIANVVGASGWGTREAAVQRRHARVVFQRTGREDQIAPAS